MEEFPEKFNDFVYKAYDMFWSMADYSSHYCIRFNNFIHNGIPQNVTLEVSRNLDKGQRGYYLEYESHIVIKDQIRNQNKMLKTLEHELAHLFLVEALAINPEHNNHPVEFWEFIRRYRRYRRKNAQ